MFSDGRKLGGHTSRAHNKRKPKSDMMNEESSIEKEKVKEEEQE